MRPAFSVISWVPFTGSLTERGRDQEAFAQLTGIERAEAAEPKLQRRVMKDWTSLYGHCAGWNAEGLAALAAETGIRLYGPAPLQVIASRNLLCVHIRQACRMTLNLPSGTWHEVFTNQRMTGGSWTFQPQGVALFQRVQAARTAGRRDATWKAVNAGEQL